MLYGKNIYLIILFLIVIKIHIIFYQMINYILNQKIISNIKNSLWNTNFGGDWIAQIQLYHHFLNNRIMFLLVQLVRENLQCHHFFLYMLLKY